MTWTLVAFLVTLPGVALEAGRLGAFTTQVECEVAGAILFHTDARLPDGRQLVWFCEPPSP